MPVSGPVTTLNPVAVSHMSSPNGNRDYRYSEYPHARSESKPSLGLIIKQNQANDPCSSSASAPLKQRSSHDSNGRTFYNPITDTSEPSSQHSDAKREYRMGDSSANSRSPESARSAGTHPPLPPISQLTEYPPFENQLRHDRHSPPSQYARSPMSLTTDMTSPYTVMRNANQPYHAQYEASPASSHSTISPHDRYTQNAPSRTSSQYEGQRYRDTPGHTPIADMRTPISASTQATFSPMSNDRSPVTEQHPFNREGASPPTAPAVPGLYQCMHEDCVGKPPFQTQYLLSSHQNVHKPDRPYYCQVPECPRSKNGKPNSGFKRKNELIRHQLVHNSPGYACPFCPDRDHKYPRPDNLQRHVKVHHTDKSKDDPELRAILAQRIDSDKSGRRRRNNSTS